MFLVWHLVHSQWTTVRIFNKNKRSPHHPGTIFRSSGQQDQTSAQNKWGTKAETVSTSRRKLPLHLTAGKQTLKIQAWQDLQLVTEETLAHHTFIYHVQYWTWKKCSNFKMVCWEILRSDLKMHWKHWLSLPFQPVSYGIGWGVVTTVVHPRTKHHSEPKALIITSSISSQ